MPSPYPIHAHLRASSSFWGCQPLQDLGPKGVRPAASGLLWPQHKVGPDWSLRVQEPVPQNLSWTLLAPGPRVPRCPGLRRRGPEMQLQRQRPLVGLNHGRWAGRPLGYEPAPCWERQEDLSSG